MKKIIQSVLPYLLVFTATIYKPLDPDLGWHLRYGENFFKTGHVLRENIFSTIMPNFKWANISWGVDLLYYIFYHMGGFLGLSLASAGVVGLTFFVFSKAYKLDYYEKSIIFPVVLLFLQPVNFNSFRGQLVSMLLLGILMYLLLRFEDGRKRILFFVPLIFLFWSNLHGLFLLGLGTFFLWEGIFIVSKYLDGRSIKELLPYLKLFIPITMLSLLATIIHPFGIEIYKDGLMHVSDPLLKRISEYGSVEQLSQQWYGMIIAGILAVTGSIVFYARKTTLPNLPRTGIFYVMYALSISVRRYSWGMYYLIIPFLKPFADFFKPDDKKGEFKLGTVFFVLSLAIVFLVKYPYAQFINYNWNDYCQQILKCSPKATTVLRKYYVENKTYTTYNWGGYMIWNFPDMKPSTDGRMHLWRDENGFSGFEQDYRIEQNLDDVEFSKYDVVFTVRNKPIYKRLINLAMENKWRLVYRDDYAAIFVRNKNQNSAVIEE